MGKVNVNYYYFFLAFGQMSKYWNEQLNKKGGWWVAAVVSVYAMHSRSHIFKNEVKTTPHCVGHTV